MKVKISIKSVEKMTNMIKIITKHQLLSHFSIKFFIIFIHSSSSIFLHCPFILHQYRGERERDRLLLRERVGDREFRGVRERLRLSLWRTGEREWRGDRDRERLGGDRVRERERRGERLRLRE